MIKFKPGMVVQSRNGTIMTIESVNLELGEIDYVKSEDTHYRYWDKIEKVGHTHIVIHDPSQIFLISEEDRLLALFT